MEKQRDKAAKRLQRKLAREAGVSESGDLDTDEFSESTERQEDTAEDTAPDNGQEPGPDQA